MCYKSCLGSDCLASSRSQSFLCRATEMSHHQWQADQKQHCDAFSTHVTQLQKLLIYLKSNLRYYTALSRFSSSKLSPFHLKLTQSKINPDFIKPRIAKILLNRCNTFGRQDRIGDAGLLVTWINKLILETHSPECFSSLHAAGQLGTAVQVPDH